MPTKDRYGGGGGTEGGEDTSRGGQQRRNSDVGLDKFEKRNRGESESDPAAEGRGGDAPEDEEEDRNRVGTAADAIAEAARDALAGTHGTASDPMEALNPATPNPPDEMPGGTSQADERGIEQAKQALNKHIVSHIRDDAVARHAFANCGSLYDSEVGFITREREEDGSVGFGLPLSSEDAVPKWMITHEFAHMLLDTHGYDFGRVGEVADLRPEGLALRLLNNEVPVPPPVDWTDDGISSAELFMLTRRGEDEPVGVGAWWPEIEDEFGVSPEVFFAEPPETPPTPTDEGTPPEDNHPFVGRPGFEVPNGDPEAVREAKVRNLASAANKAWLRQTVVSFSSYYRDVGADFEPYKIKDGYGTAHAHETAARGIEPFRLRTEEFGTQGTATAALDDVVDNHPELAVALLDLFEPTDPAAETLRENDTAREWGMTDYFL